MKNSLIDIWLSTWTWSSHDFKAFLFYYKSMWARYISSSIHDRRFILFLPVFTLWCEQNCNSMCTSRPSMCTPVTPAVPYLLLGLQDVQWAVGNSRDARKLARTPHVNQKKKNCNSIFYMFWYVSLKNILNYFFLKKIWFLYNDIKN